MDIFQLLEGSGYVAPPNETTVQGAVDLVLADAFHEARARTGPVSAPGQGRRAPRRGAYLAGAAAMVAAAVGAAVPLSLSGGNLSAAPALKLASYSFRLPAHYRLTAASTNACSAMWVFGENQDLAPTTPGYASQVSAAASASGGCLVMTLAPPYTPSAQWPDPEALSGGQAVQVGPYDALVRTGPVIYTSAGYGPSETVLDVELPLAGGQFQDLVVAEQGLSQAALVTLVANGLSASTESPTTTS